ncbi:histone acetyltransferase [Ranunculus cassubicifolius]
MGLKQALSDQSTDPKKKRRVGFTTSAVGIEANECIKIFLVSKKEEVGCEDGDRIDPIDLNQFFDKDGRIYGYQDLKLNVYLSSVTFHAYADISFQSTSDGGKGITDLKPALEKVFGEHLVENKDEFLQTFSSGVHYVRDVVTSHGEVLHRESINEGTNDEEYQIIRMPVNNYPVGEFYCQLVPLLLLLVDGSSPIDITDSSWSLYLAVESKKDDKGEIYMKLLGAAAVYRFYYYPESSRLRLSQILVLPPYQGKGHGRRLLEVLNSVAVSENVYDLAVEEPSDPLQSLRTQIDLNRLLTFSPIKEAVTSFTSQLKNENLSKKTHKVQSDPPASVVDETRKTFKIHKKQILQCWEILIYLELDHKDPKSMKNFKTLITERTRDDVIGNADAGGDGGKQIIETPNEYDDHEMTFVMFRPSDNVQVDNVNAEIQENQENIEEQLKELVDIRMKEIVEIASKVALPSQ